MSNRAKEHAIPNWLIQYLNLKDWSCRSIGYGNDGYALNSKANIGSQSLLAGRVCISCNNGWMSALEGNVKPVLISLLDASRTLTDLNAEQRILLARWTVKTAYMINHTWKEPPIILPNHLEQLYKGKTSLPNGVTVFAHQHPVSSYIGWIQGRDWPCIYLLSDEKDARAMHARSYRLALQIGNLLLLVAYWPGRLWTYAMRNIIYNRIWPTGQYFLQGDVRLTQIRQKEWEKAPDALREFYDSLEAVHQKVIQRVNWGRTSSDGVPVTLISESNSTGELLSYGSDLNRLLRNPSQEQIVAQRFMQEHEESVDPN